jgi:hypothetical protein
MTKAKTEPKRKSFEMRKLKYADWIAEGEQRFGADRMQWRFVCPICRHVATVKDWKDAGAPEGSVAFACVGRWTGTREAPARDAFGGKGKGPCNYTGGGLFALNPVQVELEDGKTAGAFEFDGAQPEAQAAQE